MVEGDLVEEFGDAPATRSFRVKWFFVPVLIDTGRVVDAETGRRQDA